MTEPTRREREWGRRHEEILSAAARLFAEHGFAATTVQMIAEAADFSVGYLYRHFDGKQAILDEMTLQEVQRFETVVDSVAARPGLSPLQRYRLQLSEACRLLGERKSLVRIFFEQEPNLGRAVRMRLKKSRERDIRLLEEAFAAGELPLVDFQSLAVLLDGVFWQLMVEFSRTGAALDFTRIPDLIDEFVLTPLQGRLEERITKEGTTT